MVRVHRPVAVRCGRLAGAFVTVSLVGCGGVAPAPAAGTLPLAAHARVIAAAGGASQVNPAHDRNRYRYVALGGPPHTIGANLLVAEVRSLRGHGWGRERAVGFRGTATVAQPVPVTAPGAEVLLDSPDGKEYAAISLLADRAVAGVQTSHTPLSHSAAIATALRDRRPVLWIVLGNGTHS